MEEIWKPVAGYEGLYEVSSLGRIKSLERFSKEHWNNGTLCRTRIRERIMKGTPDQDGYLDVALTDERGKQKYYRINRLVAIAFLPNPNNLPQVDHLNCVKDDNRAENLEWVSCRENIVRAWKAGRCHPQPRTREHTHNVIRSAIEKGRPCKSVEDGKKFINILYACRYHSLSENIVRRCLLNGSPYIYPDGRQLHFEFIDKNSAEYEDLLIKFRAEYEQQSQH